MIQYNVKNLSPFLQEQIVLNTKKDETFLMTVANERAFDLIAYTTKRLLVVHEVDKDKRPFANHFLVFVPRTEYEQKQKEVVSQGVELVHSV